jgi:hypothetical protein
LLFVNNFQVLGFYDSRATEIDFSILVSSLELMF